MALNLEEKQKHICSKYNSPYQYCDLNLKVGIARNVKDGVKPIHGLRVSGENGTNGWYIWAGDWSDDPDFFLPLHGVHLLVRAEMVMPFLGLAKGWRFLIDDGYEDVWEDPELSAQ